VDADACDGVGAASVVLQETKTIFAVISHSTAHFSVNAGVPLFGQSDQATGMIKQGYNATILHGVQQLAPFVQSLCAR
jgi:hypothetical protein